MNINYVNYVRMPCYITFLLPEYLHASPRVDMCVRVYLWVSAICVRAYGAKVKIHSIFLFCNRNCKDVFVTPRNEEKIRQSILSLFSDLCARSHHSSFWLYMVLLRHSLGIINDTTFSKWPGECSYFFRITFFSVEIEKGSNYEWQNRRGVKIILIQIHSLLTFYDCY